MNNRLSEENLCVYQLANRDINLRVDLNVRLRGLKSEMQLQRGPSTR